MACANELLANRKISLLSSNNQSAITQNYFTKISNFQNKNSVTQLNSSKNRNLSDHESFG
jgi:hypothetical protein